MADGLLLTRRERLRLYWLKFGCAAAPQLALAIAALAVMGVLLALFVASSARKPRGALIGGIVCAVVLFLFQLVVAWFATHPIE
jgi:multisubunit Na+/H+ antiporter MnhB subunit